MFLLFKINRSKSILKYFSSVQENLLDQQVVNNNMSIHSAYIQGD